MMIRIKMKNSRISIFVVSLLLLASSISADAAPKYGPAGTPHAIPLSISNEFFRKPKNPQPQFWALISFYVPQGNHASCSVASAVMVLNAARAHMAKTAEEKVISEPELLDKIHDPQWKLRVSPGGEKGIYGLNLDLFGDLMKKALGAYSLSPAKVATYHVVDTSSETKASVRKSLKGLSMNHFIVANFDQKAFTNDTQVGHFSPVAAYDASKDRVLILDSDREYYEPYWVSVDDFVKGMATQDHQIKKSRGYAVIEL